MENTAKPLIYSVQSSLQSQKKFDPKSFFKNNLGKIIFGILGLIILAELVIGIQGYVSKNKEVQSADKIQPLSGGQIIVDSHKSDYGISETVPVNIRVVTGGRPTESTDLVLQYDPDILEATSSAIELGKIYLDYPISDVDSQKGVIRISGITPPGDESFNGIGEFASINFVAKKQGSTKVSVEFTSGSTIDSNLVESGKPNDLLTEVKNLDLNIGTSSNTKNIVSNKCSGFTQYCQDADGLAGTQKCYDGVVSQNACVFDPKLTTRCEVCNIK